MTSIRLRQDIPVEDVRRAATGQPDQIARRFTLIAALLTGMPRSEAAKQLGVTDDYTIRWVRAFNAAGVNGLRRLRLRIPFRNDVSTTDLTITAIQRFIGELHYAIHGPTLDQPAASDLEAGRRLVVRMASAHEMVIECQATDLHQQDETPRALLIAYLERFSLPVKARERLTKKIAALRADHASLDQMIRRFCTDKPSMRMLAIADRLRGMSRAAAAKKYGWSTNLMTTLAARFNAEGIDGLVDPDDNRFQRHRQIAIRSDISLTSVIDAAAMARGSEKPRFIAIAYMLRGYSRMVAAGKAKLSEGTLKEWITRFNENGIQGLYNVPHSSSQTLIIRTDIPAQDVRQAAKTVDAKAQAPLLGIADVLDGHGRAASAHKFGACPSTMTNWIHRFNRAGIDGLLRNKRIGNTAKLRDDIPVAMVRQAASKTRKRHIKRRLQVIAALLVGDDRPKIARKWGVNEASISIWIFHFNNDGLAGLGYVEPVSIKVGNSSTPCELRQTALKTPRKVGKRRLLGMAKMMEGADIRQVAAEANVSEASVEGWITLFATGGVKGLIYGTSQIHR